jgi:hypothetical protein
MGFLRSKNTKRILVILGFFLFLFVCWYFLASPAKQGDWQEQLKVLSTAEFDGDMVTVKNIRNFRYGPTEADMHPAYYDKTYNLSKIKKVWYVTEPFNENDWAAHTFLSFEFEGGEFLAITIEARKTKNQTYSMGKGIMRTYPLIYIAADERDVILLRANLRKDKVYVYPVKLEKQENARLLLVDMLQTMNKLGEHPEWYNTLFANCTSVIAKHVNRLTPGRVSQFSWQLWLTASADELALKHGLLDTDLSIEQARAKYIINEASQKAGDVSGYSQMIRNFGE